MFTLEIGIAPDGPVAIGAQEAALSQLAASGFHARSGHGELVTSLAINGPPMESVVLKQFQNIQRTVQTGSVRWSLRSLYVTGTAFFSNAVPDDAGLETLAHADQDDSELTIVYMPYKHIATLSLCTRAQALAEIKVAMAFEQAARLFMIQMSIHRQAKHMRDMTDIADMMMVSHLDAIDVLVRTAMPSVAAHWKSRAVAG